MPLSEGQSRSSLLLTTCAAVVNSRLSLTPLREGQSRSPVLTGWTASINSRLRLLREGQSRSSVLAEWAASVTPVNSRLNFRPLREGQSRCWAGSVSDAGEQPFNSTPMSREHASPWIRQREWAGCCWRCQSEECQSASVWMNQTGSVPSLDLQYKASKWYTILPAILVPEVGPAPYVTWICGVEKNKICMFYTCMLGQWSRAAWSSCIRPTVWKWWRLFRRKADNLFAVKTNTNQLVWHWCVNASGILAFVFMAMIMMRIFGLVLIGHTHTHTRAHIRTHAHIHKCTHTRDLTTMYWLVECTMIWVFQRCELIVVFLINFVCSSRLSAESTPLRWVFKTRQKKARVTRSESHATRAQWVCSRAENSAIQKRSVTMVIIQWGGLAYR